MRFFLHRPSQHPKLYFQMLSAKLGGPGNYNWPGDVLQTGTYMCVCMGGSLAITHFRKLAPNTIHWGMVATGASLVTRYTCAKKASLTKYFGMTALTCVCRNNSCYAKSTKVPPLVDGIPLWSSMCGPALSRTNPLC